MSNKNNFKFTIESGKAERHYWTYGVIENYFIF